MKIYIVHSTSFDYKTELYQPIKNWRQSTFILPHDTQNEPLDSKQVIKECDLIIAEVSYPSTGSGIELGWGNMHDRRILCIHKEDCKPSSSLKMVSSDFLSYSSPEDLIQKLENWMSEHISELNTNNNLM